MSRILAAIGRKVLGLALIFNSILSLISALNILFAFYANECGWRSYFPYLIDGSLFWFVALTSILNIFPARRIGRADVKRFLFHHYVYGFLTSFTAILSLVVFAPAYLLVLLVPSLGFQTAGFQTLPIYIGSFFVYGGLTLMIDDLHDVSFKMERFLGRVGMRILEPRKALQVTHLCSSLISVYVMVCGILWYLENSLFVMSWSLWDVSHAVFMSNLLVTSVLGLRAVKEESWLSARRGTR